MHKAKVAFLDHPFHRKTSSSLFFKSLLYQRFNVEVFYIEDNAYPSLEAVNAFEPDIVLCWQTELCAPAFLARGFKVVCVPMYDGSANAPVSYWKLMAEARFINFSHALHQRLSELGLNSLHTQYFPPGLLDAPQAEFENLDALFWQRRPEYGLDFRFAKTLLGSVASRIHVHNAPDVEPRENWEPEGVESVSHYDDDGLGFRSALDSSNLFLCPRLTEGIGMPLLEAMARGMCIIANDAPTANEYLENGKTGLLVDYRSCPRLNGPDTNSPEALTLARARQLGLAARTSFEKGVSRWQRSIPRLLDWIEQTPRSSGIGTIASLSEGYADALATGDLPTLWESARTAHSLSKAVVASNALLARGENVGADAFIAAQLKAVPGLADLLFLQSAAKLRSKQGGEIELSLDLAKVAFALNRNNPVFRINLAEALLRNHKAQDVFPLMEPLCRPPNLNPYGFVFGARAMSQMGNKEGAIRHLMAGQALLKDHPDNRPIEAELAKFNLQPAVPQAMGHDFGGKQERSTDQERLRKAQAVFIHSWWRSSSTYIWNKLRLDDGNISFKEPLHTALTSGPSQELKEALDQMESTEILFHPVLNRGYFEEYRDIEAAGVLLHSVPAVSYDEFVLGANARASATEFHMARLLRYSIEKGKRPIFCSVRTLGRVSALKSWFDGAHVALLRDPIDQWGAMAHQLAHGNRYFLDSTALVACKASRDPEAAALLAPLGYRDSDQASYLADMAHAGQLVDRLGLLNLFEAYVSVMMLCIAKQWEDFDCIIDTTRLQSDSQYKAACAREFETATGINVEFIDFSRAERMPQRTPLLRDAMKRALSRLSDERKKSLAQAADTHGSLISIKNLVA